MRRYLNKKGFTLVELLATIVIIALVATIVTIAVTGVLRQTRSNIDDITYEEVTRAADLYFTSNYSKFKSGDMSNFTINDLYENEFLEVIPKDKDGNVYWYEFSVSKDANGKPKIDDFSKSDIKAYPTLQAKILESKYIKEAMDFNGESATYFEGIANNNYVKFTASDKLNGKWRILRINGDGTIRIVYDSYLTPALTYNGTSWSSRTNVIKVAMNEYNEEINNSLVVEGSFCYENVSSSSINSTYNRFTCNSSLTKSKIGLLSLSEAKMYNIGDNNTNNSFIKSWNYFLSTTTNNVQILNVSKNASSYEQINYSSNHQGYIKPVVNLDANVLVSSGSGTSSSPYVLK